MNPELKIGLIITGILTIIFMMICVFAVCAAAGRADDMEEERLQKLKLEKENQEKAEEPENFEKFVRIWSNLGYVSKSKSIATYCVIIHILFEIWSLFQFSIKYSSEIINYKNFNIIKQIYSEKKGGLL